MKTSGKGVQPHARQAMPRQASRAMRRLADLLTGSRFFLAVLIGWIVWTRPAEIGLGKVVVLVLVAWTTDALDGGLARRAQGTNPSWLGAHDLEADLSIALAMTLSLAVWGGAPPWLLVGALLLALLGWLGFHTLAPVHVGMALVYLLFILMAWRQEVRLGAAVVAWIAAVVLFTRPRVQTQVAGFLDTFRGIFSH